MGSDAVRRGEIGPGDFSRVVDSRGFYGHLSYAVGGGEAPPTELSRVDPGGLYGQSVYTGGEIPPTDLGGGFTSSGNAAPTDFCRSRISSGDLRYNEVPTIPG